MVNLAMFTLGLALLMLLMLLLGPVFFKEEGALLLLPALAFADLLFFISAVSLSLWVVLTKR